MELGFLVDLVKIYGPLSLGWVAAFYMLKFVLDRYAADIDARVKMANAIDSLTRIIEGMEEKGK
jgi:hypothetical protein